MSKTTKIDCHIVRIYERGMWLLTLMVGLDHACRFPLSSGYPQAWAVQDDFGVLVAVEPFG